jgi:photosystem II stability/assembly factor-like uncharacterized protein
MPELDFDGLREAIRAAFRPHFAEVVHRAGRRRRRTRAVGAVAAVAVLATGTGTAARMLSQHTGTGPGTPVGALTTPDFIPPAAPSGGPVRSGHRVATGAMVAGDVDHLYLKYGDCQGADCTARMAASTDGGASWTTRALPVPHNALVQLFALGPRTLLAWVQDYGTGSQRWLASTDAGQAWHEVTVHDTDAVPAGWQPLDRPGNLDQIRVLAADPASGNIVQLAQPRVLDGARVAVELRPAAGLWITGYTGRVDTSPVTFQGSAVDVSHDGGRTWHRATLPEDLSAGDGFAPAALASYDGQTAYAVGTVAGTLVVYRSVDGGTTWQRAPLVGPVREGIGERRIHAAVRADGALTIQVGDQAGDDPVMYQSTDEGRTVTRVPVGPGADAVPTTGGYAQSGWPNSSGVWLSPDGTGWSYVGPPKLP